LKYCKWFDALPRVEHYPTVLTPPFSPHSGLPLTLTFGFCLPVSENIAPAGLKEESEETKPMEVDAVTNEQTPLIEKPLDV